MLKIDKKDLLFVFIILFTAMLFRAAYLKDYKNTSAYPVLAHSDAYSYFVWAKDITSGDFGLNKAFMKWPLYAYFLAFLFNLFGENLFLVYILQFILGAINCLFIYIIGRELFNRGIGFVAGLFCAWYGLFVFYEGMLIYTSLSLFLNSLLFLFILHIKDNLKIKSLFWVGIFLGICTIAQASIVIFGILAIIWILRLKKLSLSETLTNFSFFILGLGIVIGSVTLRNYLAEKDFVLVAGNIGINFYLGNNSKAAGTFFSPHDITLNQEDMFRDAGIIARDETQRALKTSGVSNFWFGKAIDFIRKDTAGYLRLLFKKLTYVLNKNEFVHDIEYQLIRDKIGVLKVMFKDLKFLLTFALLGMLLGLRRFKESALLYIFLISVSFSITMFFVSARYRIVIVPVIMIFSACGFFYLWEALRKKGFFRFCLLSLTLAGIFILLNFNSTPKTNIKSDLKNYSAAFDYHLTKAIVYEDNSDYPSAILELNSARKIQPNNRRAIFRLGVIHYFMNDFQAAEEDFKEVIKISPLSFDAYYNLGLMYNLQQRFNEAEGVLDRAVFLDPLDAAAHFELGIASKFTGNVKKAKEEFGLALKKMNRWRVKEKEIIKKELSGLGK